MVVFCFLLQLQLRQANTEGSGFPEPSGVLWPWSIALSLAFSEILFLLSLKSEIGLADSQGSHLNLSSQSLMEKGPEPISQNLTPPKTTTLSWIPFMSQRVLIPDGTWPEMTTCCHPLSMEPLAFVHKSSGDGGSSRSLVGSWARNKN